MVLANSLIFVLEFGVDIYHYRSDTLRSKSFFLIDFPVNQESEQAA